MTSEVVLSLACNAHSPPTERFKETVIEERKKSAEALLYFASYYQHLTESQPLRQFLSVSQFICDIVYMLCCMCSVVPSWEWPRRYAWLYMLRMWFPNQ